MSQNHEAKHYIVKLFRSVEKVCVELDGAFKLLQLRSHLEVERQRICSTRRILTVAQVNSFNKKDSERREEGRMVSNVAQSHHMQTFLEYVGHRHLKLPRKSDGIWM